MASPGMSDRPVKGEGEGGIEKRAKMREGGGIKEKNKKMGNASFQSFCQQKPWLKTAITWQATGIMLLCCT